MRTGAVVHVATINEGSAALVRNDNGAWKGVARRTGGLLWTAYASNDAAKASEMARVYEEWARPLRIDYAKIESPELEVEAFGSPRSLAEGEGFEDLRIAPVEVSAVELTGEIWSQRFHMSFAPDPVESQRWSALVFGAPLGDELREDEMMVLARRGHAVSPVTSFLAIEPGVRPSTEGLEEGEGHGRLGGSHVTRAPKIRYGATSVTPAFDHKAFLAGELARAWQTCGGAGRAVTISIETTLAEIVDVPRVTIDGTRDARLEQCLGEAAWAIDLPPQFTASSASWTLKV
jgi:hypothetical protein